MEPAELCAPEHAVGSAEPQAVVSFGVYTGSNEEGPHLLGQMTVI